MPNPLSPYKFDSAVLALEDAVRRLRLLPRWDKWITFVAQGKGSGADHYQFAEVRMLGHRLDVGGLPLQVARIIQMVHTGASSLVADGDYYSVAAASSQEVAQLLDAIFRHHFGIRPFVDDGNDYLVGAEWRHEHDGFSA